MASPAPLLLPVVLALLNQPVVKFGAWASNVSCDYAALIRIHLGESPCDATMITGHWVIVNDLAQALVHRSLKERISVFDALATR
jgi:hypothetical protein